MSGLAHSYLTGFSSPSKKFTTPLARCAAHQGLQTTTPGLSRRPLGISIQPDSNRKVLIKKCKRGVALDAANPSKDDLSANNWNPQTLLDKLATSDSLKGDIYGGVTASVVALPLALAFGVASGLGPQAGLYGAIFAGFFAALFGGTPAQVTGPTGPMTVVTAASVAQFTGDPTLVFTTVFLAGLMQIVMGFLKLGSFIRLVPTVVLTGFMSGIGFIILLTQLPPLFGLPTAPNALAALGAIPNILSQVNPHASLIGLLSLALCTFTPRKVSRIVPGSLLALVIGTLVATMGNLSVPCLGHIPSQLPRPLGVSLPMEFLPAILKSSFILAILGGIDSLLTSLVADSMTSTYHDSDQEMIGQGLGNAVAGIFGGIPSAGATMRTVINIRSGGTTRLAGAIHSVVLLAVVIGLGSVAKNIPLAVLAGILMKTGLDIIDLDFFKRIPKLPSSLTSVMVCVMLMTVFVDLIVAVATGCVLSSLLLVKQLADSQIDGCNVITRQDIQAGGGTEQLSFAERAKIVMGRGQVGLFTMQGSFTFSASNGMLRKVLPKMEKFQASVIDLSNVTLIDGDAALALEEMARREAKNGHKLYVCGASTVVGDLLDKMGVSEKLAIKPYSSTDGALQAALDDLGIESSATVCKFD